MMLGEVARRLRELVAALDRRAPRVGYAAEAAIARDAAALREKALNRLAEIAGQTTSAPDVPLDRVSRRRMVTALNRTAFPATPGEVAPLTPQEFTSDLDDLDGNRAPSMEQVCRTFMDDANRALVWWIRFEALKAWRARTDIIARLNSGSVTLRDACDVAASFPLNHHWEFEPDDFCSAIEAVTVRRAQVGAGAGSAS
jgi:hypothetical protein